MGDLAAGKHAIVGLDPAVSPNKPTRIYVQSQALGSPSLSFTRMHAYYHPVLTYIFHRLMVRPVSDDGLKRVPAMAPH